MLPDAETDITMEAYIMHNDYYAKDYFTNGVDLYVCKHQKAPIYSAPLHRHDFAELAYTYSGKARHIVNGVSYPVERGTLIFINYKYEKYEKTEKELLVKINVIYRDR